MANYNNFKFGNLESVLRLNLQIFLWHFSALCAYACVYLFIVIKNKLKEEIERELIDKRFSLEINQSMSDLHDESSSDVAVSLQPCPSSSSLGGDGNHNNPLLLTNKQYFASISSKRVRSLSPLGLTGVNNDSGTVLLDSVDSQTAISAGFLAMLHPMTRRQLLALHETHCRTEREEEFTRRRQAEDEKLLIEKLEHAFRKKNKNQASSSSSSTATESLTHAAFASTSTVAGNGKGGCRSTSLIQWLYETAGVRADIQLNEHWSLRTSIYDKFIAHFQVHYNSHDATALMEQVFYPCCQKDMIRELKLWTHKPTNQCLGPIKYGDRELVGEVTAGGIEQYPGDAEEEKQEEEEVNWMTHDSPSINAYFLAGSRRVLGSHSLFLGYRHMFEKLPDCVMLFDSHRTTVTHLPDIGRTVVVAPYAYYFTVVIPASGLEDPQYTAVFPSPAFPGMMMKAVEIECRVWYVTRYNALGRVDSECFHITLTGCSDPSLTQDDVIRYVGLDAVPNRSNGL